MAKQRDEDAGYGQPARIRRLVAQWRSFHLCQIGVAITHKKGTGTHYVNEIYPGCYGQSEIRDIAG